MKKYFIYGLIILLILLMLEWSQVVDIPFIDIPDFTGSKKEMLHKAKDALKGFD